MRCLLFILLLCSSARADDWQRIVCIDDPRLTVTLLLKSTASPADEEFVGWELNNLTDQPLKVSNARYRLDGVTISQAAEGRPISHSSMASGNPYDLLWREGRPPERREDVVPPGVMRRLRYCSTYSLAITGFPREEAWTLEGQATFEITFADRTTLTTKSGGVPFRFKLVPADAAAFTAMSERLQRTLATPGDPFADAYALRTFLAVDQVTKTVDLKTLLAGWRTHDSVSRPAIREYIDQHYPTDEQTIAFCLDVIQRRDQPLLMELAATQRIRDVRLIDPLIACVRADDLPYHRSAFALEILRRHRDLMPDRAATTGELGRIMLARLPHLENGQLPGKDQRWRWEESVRLLSLTGDAAMTKYLLPYLDRDDVIVDAKMIAVMNNGVSTRASDVAYNALLVLLDRPEPPFTMEIGSGVIRHQTSPKQEYIRRNKLIETLKDELSGKSGR